MSSDWRDFRLGDLCTFQSGHAFKPQYQGKSQGQYPFIKVSDMNTDGNEICIRDSRNWVDDIDLAAMGAKPCPAGATVFAKIGVALTSNRRRRLVRDTIIDNNMLAAIARPDMVDELFLYYWLQMLDMNTIAAGTALPYLRVSDLNAVPVSLPPAYAQRAIASVLRVLDDKIELNQTMSRTLDVSAQTLFTAWFIRFDGLSASDLGVGAPVEIVDPTLGRIPASWERGTLADILTLQRGFDLPKQDRAAGMYPVIAATGCVGTHARYAVRGPGVVIGRSGSIGGGQWVEEDFWPLNTTLWVKDFKDNDPAFCYYLLRSIDFSRFNAGSSVPTLNRNHVADLPVAIPPRAVRDRFSGYARACLKRRSVAARESSSLAQIRDALLPPLLSGELRVSDAEKVVEEVV